MRPGAAWKSMERAPMREAVPGAGFLSLPTSPLVTLAVVQGVM